MKTVTNIVSIIVVAIVGYFAVVWILNATKAAGSSKGGGGFGAGGGGGASPFSSLFGNNLGRTMQQSFQSILQANLPALGLQTTDPGGDSGVFIPPEPIQPIDLSGFGYVPDGGGGGGAQALIDAAANDSSGLDTSYNDSSWAVS